MKLSKTTTVFFILIMSLGIMLRFFHLGDIPPSLYTDEADQGYNAYSILLTYRDEHGSVLPVSLRSFGDWKPPLPTYLMIPFISLFGLSELSVRLPSAILGAATIFLTFFLVRLLLSEEKYRDRLALISAFYLSVSGWHILESRAAMLVSVGLFFLTLGIYTFLKASKNKVLLFFSSASFVLSIYSYYGLRVVTPLILIFLLIKHKDSLFLSLKQTILAFLFGLILLTPLFVAFLRQPDVVFGRARTVSIFYDQGINLRKGELITQDGITASVAVTRFFHNNFYMYGRSIVQRFLSHWDGRFLFVVGDQSQPFQVPGMGILNFADLLFIPLGLIILFRNKYKSRFFISFWILASIFPAALTFVTPSSNRTFNAAIPYVLLAALGTAYICKLKLAKPIAATFAALFYMVSLGYFLNSYFVKTPVDHADWWNYGWREVVEYVKNEQPKYENIIIPDVGMPYIYFLFYQKYSPGQFQKEAIRIYVADRFGFEHVEGFGKYIFPAEFDWNFAKKNNLFKNSLYVIPAAASADNDYIKAIYYPSGKIAFKIFSYE